MKTIQVQEFAVRPLSAREQNQIHRNYDAWLRRRGLHEEANFRHSLANRSRRVGRVVAAEEGGAE